MPRSKESSDELRRKVVEAHKAGKGYKTIAKVLDLHRSTVRQIIYKWKAFNTTATRPRSGRPTKLDTILRLMGSAAGPESTTAEDGRAEGEAAARIPDNENEAAEDVCRNSEVEGTVQRTGKYEEDKNAWVLGTDTNLKSANVAVRVKIEDNVLIFDNPLRASDPEVTRSTPKRTRRRRIGKTKDLKPTRSHNLASPSTPSSSRAPVIPQPETPTASPAQHHTEDMLCCEICGACFTTEPALEAHQARHLVLHECDECGKVLQSAAGLTMHKKLKHICRDEAECE